MSLESPAGARVVPMRERATTETNIERCNLRSRILIVENHPVYAVGLKALLSEDPTFEVVGHATDSATAMPLIRFSKPDLILLDIGLRQENGLDLIPRFRRISPKVRIAVITAHEDHEHMMTAVRLGAQAFIQKELPGESILTAVRQVLQGERVIPQAASMTAALTELGSLLQTREREHSKLTAQELSILRLAADGYKNKEIGAHEFLSEVTIKRKLQDIYRKLNVTGKPAAVAEAMKLGFI
ncbi:MAG TPA: response regulator transcription factor [Ktedonobacterales bacterium]